MSGHAAIPIGPIKPNDRPGNAAARPRRSLSSRIDAALTLQNAKILSYFLIWFTLSVVYNVCNKKAHQALDLPMFLATFQMFAGVPVIVIIWLSGIRQPPSIFEWRLFRSLSFMSLCHSGTHLGGVGSMGLGAVSFTHIIKASEPVFTAVLSVFVLGQVYAWQVYLTLAMVCIGVAVASVAEMDFNALALNLALLSSLSASLRGTFSKEALKSIPSERKLQAQNLYYVLTILSSIFCAVLFAASEGAVFLDNFNNGLLKQGHVYVWGNLIASGLSYYLYNEVAFLALDAVSPVTHAIGSTFKRVFVIGAALIVFRNPVNVWGYIGSVIAIVSVFAYSLTKIWFPSRTIRKPFSSSTTKC